MAQIKQGKWQKKIHVRENTGNLEICQNTGKTQGIWFAQVVNSLMTKVKDIAIFATKISIFFQKLDRSAKSNLCMKYLQIMEIGTGKFCGWTGKTQGKHREFENTI